MLLASGLMACAATLPTEAQPTQPATSVVVRGTTIRTQPITFTFGDRSDGQENRVWLRVETQRPVQLELLRVESMRDGRRVRHAIQRWQVDRGPWQTGAASVSGNTQIGIELRTLLGVADSDIRLVLKVGRRRVRVGFEASSAHVHMEYVQ